MNRVSGRVLALESKRGIPDLVVALLDIDAAQSIDAVGAQSAATHIPAGMREGEGAFRDRIGSVLTDAFGRFEITFEDDAFRLGDAEKRPDLLVVVYAPEDVVDPVARTPSPPNARILIRSQIPRQDAGREEAYILRIPLDDLRKFDIPVPGRANPAPDGEAAHLISLDALARVSLEEQVRESLREHMTAKSHRARGRNETSAAYAASLTATSTAQRGSETFVYGSRTVSEVAPVAVSRGLDRIRSANPVGPLQYRADDGDFEIAGVPRPSDTMAPIDLDHDQVCRLLLARRPGPALRRVVELLDAERNRRIHFDALADATANGTSGETGSGIGTGDPGADEELSTRALLEAGIREQLQELAAPEAEAATTLEELSARLNGFRLPVGPADVTALHDFHQLQIAFEHVWVEAFDEELRDEVRTLYGEIVELHEDVDGVFDLPAEAGEIDEIGEILRGVGQDVETLAEPPPPAVARYWPDAEHRWHLLSESQQLELIETAEDLDSAGPALLFIGLIDELTAERARELSDELGIDVPRLLRSHERGSEVLKNPRGRLGRLIRLREEITQRLTEPHAFHYFAPNSVNFGILVTYRQHWTPIGYQVGDLASTIPLAPGETRKYSARTVRKLTRSEKELENNLASRRGESSLTQRAEAAITEKASLATNFSQTAEGSISFGIGSIGTAMEFSTNQALESARSKKDFREAVTRISHEYRQERTVEVQTSSERTAELTTSGEIRNTNNEVTVTYLFYELERQYQIRERLHQVTPVILVGQDVPAPNEITETWLLEHEWILRRVLLDDSLQLALDDLTDAFAGDELSVNVLRANWEQQKTISGRLEEGVESQRAELTRLQAELVGVERGRGLAETAERSTGQDVAAAIFTGGLSLFAPDPAEEAAERLEVARKAIEMQLEHLTAQLRDGEGRLGRAAETLSAATRDYQQALEEQTNRRVRIDQLRIHVKQNILFYMQAIWDHEPPDQRFFRLYHEEVDLPVSSTSFCTLRRARPEEVDADLPTVERFGTVYVIEGCDPPVPAPAGTNRRRIVEIADIDQPLGYKGNYIIFPLRTCTYLTEYMMRDYIDGYFGVRDPDPTAGIPSDELIDYVDAIWDDSSVELTQDERDALLNLVEARIRAPRRESDIVVVPTGELFVEALVGTHALLESFKLLHRAFDAGQARATLRESELENLRRAARLLGDDLADPDTDKTIVLSEGSDTHVHT